MLPIVISKIVGSQWRTFCGVSQDQCTHILEESLESLDYDFEKESISPTKGEQRMLGSQKDTTRFDIKYPEEFVINVISARANPLHRIMLELFISTEEMNKITSNICVVDIKGIDSTTRPGISRVMSVMMDRSEDTLWKLTHHPGLRLAVLLQLRVYIHWHYWGYI